MEKMYCPKCQGEISEVSHNCPFCGTDLSAYIHEEGKEENEVPERTDQDEQDVGSKIPEENGSQISEVNRNISIAEFCRFPEIKETNRHITVGAVCFYILAGLELFMSVTYISESWPFMCCMGAVLILAIVVHLRKSLPCAVLLFCYAVYQIIVTVLNTGMIPAWLGIFAGSEMLIGTVRLHKKWTAFRNGKPEAEEPEAEKTETENPEAEKTETENPEAENPQIDTEQIFSEVKKERRTCIWHMIAVLVISLIAGTILGSGIRVNSGLNRNFAEEAARARIMEDGTMTDENGDPQFFSTYKKPFVQVLKKISFEPGIVEDGIWKNESLGIACELDELYEAYDESELLASNEKNGENWESVSSVHFDSYLQENWWTDLYAEWNHGLIRIGVTESPERYYTEDFLDFRIKTQMEGEGTDELRKDLEKMQDAYLERTERTICGYQALGIRAGGYDGGVKYHYEYYECVIGDKWIIISVEDTDADRVERFFSSFAAPDEIEHAPVEEEKSQDPFEPGIVTESEYRNETLGLSIRIDPDWVIMNSLAREAMFSMQGRSSDEMEALEQLYLDFFAVKNDSLFQTPQEMIYVLVQDLFSEYQTNDINEEAYSSLLEEIAKEELESFMEGVKNGFADNGIEIIDIRPEEWKLDGRKMTGIDAEIETEGRKMHLLQLIDIKKPYVYTIQVFGQDKEELLQILETVSLDE